jgi:hypothetical protein
MSTLQYLFTGSAVFVAGGFALSAILGFLGVANMRSNYPAFMIAGYLVAVILFGMGWWTSAKQEEKNAKSDQENFELKNDIRDIKRVVIGVETQENATEITPEAILATLEAQRKAIIGETRNNSAYFKVADDTQNGSDLIKLQLDATGPVFTANYWISNASAKRNANDAAYWSVDQRKPLIPVITPNNKSIERSLPVGDYVIEFDALNGHWDQYLSIFYENGKLKQKIRVADSKGKLLYESEK